MMRFIEFVLYFFCYSQLLLLCNCTTTGDMTEENKNQKLTLLSMDASPLSYLALGDSYTIGESVVASGRWPNQLKDSLKSLEIYIDTVTIIAETGWRTDNLKLEMCSNDKFDFDLVSLLIGVNNQYQGQSAESYEQEFEELLNLALDRAGGDVKKVFVLSIPNYGYTPFGVGNKEVITNDLAKYNEINKRITTAKGVWYFDITPISEGSLTDTSLVAHDQLHPSAKQYGSWVAEIMRDQLFVDYLRETH